MYSQSTVIAGGLAHIPVVIGVFYFILTTFNKRALKFVEESKTKKPEAKVVEPKKVDVSKAEASKRIKTKRSSKSSKEKTCRCSSQYL